MMVPLENNYYYQDITKDVPTNYHIIIKALDESCYYCDLGWHGVLFIMTGRLFHDPSHVDVHQKFLICHSQGQITTHAAVQMGILSTQIMSLFFLMSLNMCDVIIVVETMRNNINP